MKTALGFTNWNIVIGFLISWGVWVLLEHTLFKYGIINNSDGLIITCIFTAVSYIRLYVMNSIQLKLNKRDTQL